MDAGNRHASVRRGLQLSLAAVVLLAVGTLILFGAAGLQGMARSRAAATARSHYLDAARSRRESFERSHRHPRGDLQRTSPLSFSLDPQQSHELEEHHGTSARAITIASKKDRLFAESDFTGSDFCEATLLGGFKAFQSTIFSQAKLRGAKLAGEAAFQRTVFDGALLRGATLSGGTAGFQLASFRKADLKNATLDGEGSSFQHSVFSNANLSHATLTGGASAFQLANFAGADLTHAELSAEGSGFQLACFDGANLSHASIRCNSPTAFQSASIKDADFADADLSTIDSNSLRSCLFPLENPPRYNAGTRFPNEFSPAAQGWLLK